MVGKGYTPPEAEITNVLKGVGEYINGYTTDRSSVIKLNKYLKLYGIEPVTGKEKSFEAMKPKIEKLIDKDTNQITKHQIAQEAIKYKDNKREREEQEMKGRNRAVFARLVKAFQARKEEARQAEIEEQHKLFHKFKDSFQRQPKRRVFRKSAAAAAAAPAAPAVKAKPAPALAPVPVPATATAPAVKASQIPKPLTYAAAAAPALPLAFPPPPPLSLALPPEPAAEPAAKVAGGAEQQKVKTPSAEVAKIPIAPYSVETLTVMVKDFEKVIAKYQVPGSKASTKISQEDAESLKKYNQYLDTKVTGGSTVNTLNDKLRDLRIELGLKNMSSTKKATSTTTSQIPTKGK